MAGLIRGEPLIGMGCMRLSTARDRDEQWAIAVLHAGFDAGVRFLDTADAYCWDEHEVGHNERLIARALATWRGDPTRIVVATKGGLTRPQGRWIPDGRARHLIAACESSRRALGVACVQLYQLHAPDPRTSLSTSVRALAALQHEGVVAAIGLCNVNLRQIEDARRITNIVSVQVELSIWQDENVLSGVVEYCLAHGIRVLAYRPLGGAQRRGRTRSHPALTAVAARHGATPFDVALAWLRSLSPLVLPLPGPTRVETAQALGRGRELALTDEDNATLDEQFSARRILRRGQSPDQIAPQTKGELVLIMGLPAAGKSTLARGLVAEGYARLNRDEAGGSLRGLLTAFDRLVSSGVSRIVIDNTYVSRKSRGAAIDAARKQGLAVRCVWLSTGLEDAQVNAASRMVSRYGRLLGPEEIQGVSKRDVGTFGPTVQFRYHRELEPPDPSEGFSRIDTVPFERTRDAGFSDRAVILWCEGVLRRSRSGRRTPFSVDDVEVFAGRTEVLRRHEADGWRLLGMSWQPEVAEKALTAAEAEAGFARMQELLGVHVEVEYCPHAAGPPACWCRKPLPGLGIVFIDRHRLDPSRCIYVGVGPQDPGFARRLGFQYRDAAAFFGTAS